MKLTNENAKYLYLAIENIEKSRVNIPTKFMFALTKNKSKLKGIMDEIERDRVTMVNAMGVEDANGVKDVPEEKRSLFFKDFKEEVLDKECDISFHRVSYNYLEKNMPNIQTMEGLSLVFEYLIDDDSNQKK